MGSASAGLMEFDYAVYECKPGASLVNITFPGVVNNKFLLQCPLGGTFPATAGVSWPSCRVEACTVHFVKAGYTSSAALPVDVNKVRFFLKIAIPLGRIFLFFIFHQA